MTPSATIRPRLSQQFSTKVLVLIPIAVGINVTGGMLTSLLKLPVFLDTIGTIVVACLTGPWVAALCGLLTNIFLAMVANPVYLPYAIVSVLCGLTVGFMVKAGFFTKIWGVILTWLTVSLVNTASAALVTFFVFGGATGLNGTSLLTASLVAVTQQIFLSVFSSALAENLLDKALSIAVAFFIVKRIPQRFASQYDSQASRHISDYVFDDDDDDIEDDDE